MKQSKNLVDNIIDKYEHSVEYKRQSHISRNKTLNIYNEFHGYEEADIRDSINNEATMLEKQGLIKVKWLIRELTIESIRFNVKDMLLFYNLSTRVPKIQNVEVFIKIIKNSMDIITTPWIKNYLNKIILQASKNKEFPKKMVKDLESFLSCLQGLDYIITNNLSINERAFSKKFLGGSKIFSRTYKSRIISLVRTHSDLGVNDFKDNDVLYLLGIEPMSDELWIKGNIKFNLNGHILDIFPWRYGVCLNTETLHNLTVDFAKCSNLISYENKANFEDAVSTNNEDIIVFSSGFYSSTQIQLLRKIYALKGDSINYYHSGDMDLGGMRIFIHTKENALPLLKPLNMNSEVFRSHAKFAEPFKSSLYKRQLMALKHDTRYVDFRELIDCLLEHNLILEQEALLID